MISRILFCKEVFCWYTTVSCTMVGKIRPTMDRWNTDSCDEYYDDALKHNPSNQWHIHSFIHIKSILFILFLFFCKKADKRLDAEEISAIFLLCFYAKVLEFDRNRFAFKNKKECKVKFKYSEKATKFCEISIVDLSYVRHVRQSRNYFFKPSFPPKNERTNSNETSGRLVFVRFLEEIEDTKKTFRN